MIVIPNKQQQLQKRYLARISTQTAELLADTSIFAGIKTGDSFMNSFEGILDRELKSLIRECEKGTAIRFDMDPHRFGFK